MFTLIRKKNIKGFSLLELLLVLGIIAALIVGAFIVYPKVRSSQQAEAEAKNIATIKANLLSLYAPVADVTGVNNTVAINAQIFPDNMLVKSGGTVTDVVNAFKGKVVLTTTNYVSMGKVFINLSYAAVPQEVCAKLISAVSGTMDQIVINGNTIKSDISSVAFSPSTASTICTNAGNSSTIVFSFYK